MEFAWAALAAGLISAVSLPMGASLGLAARPGPRMSSALMAFGGGALLFALTIEIVAHAYEWAGFAPLALGALAGGVAFELLNQALNSQGGFLRKAATVARYLTDVKRRRVRAILQRLARLSAFQAVPPEECAALVPRVRTLSIPAGETVCSEGQPGDDLYIVEKGEVEVLRGGEEVSRLGPGEIVGEMAVVTGAPRAATVKAASPVSLLAVRKKDYDELLAQLPEIRRRIHDLVVARSGELAARSLVDEREATEWTEAAQAHISDASLAPTTGEVKEMARAHGGAALGIWLGILLDGIPESLVIGANVSEFASISWALIAGVFLANLPEAMSSSVVMRRQEYSTARIFAMWTSITILTGVGAMAGRMFLEGISHGAFALIEGAAAGAMLTMIAETMLPEAYEQGGAIVGLSTLLGFLAALFVKSIA